MGPAVAARTAELAFGDDLLDLQLPLFDRRLAQADSICAAYLLYLLPLAEPH